MTAFHQKIVKNSEIHFPHEDTLYLWILKMVELILSQKQHERYET